MSDFMKQDIFFFVTTVAVILLTAVLFILLIYLISISRKVNYIANKAKKETDLIVDDLTQLRQNIRAEGMKLKHFVGFFAGLFKKRKK